ncbi:MAG: DUF3617 family protein [Steroidobacteraceae bacterium]
MNKKITRLSILLVVPALSATLCQAVADEATAKKGDLWQTSSQMSMDAMPMAVPAQTMQVCAAKNGTEPPAAHSSQHNCKNSDYQRVGNKVTWAVQCTGPDMTGTGEIVYDTPSSYSGALHFKSADGNVTIKLTGKKIGECDKPM